MNHYKTGGTAAQWRRWGQRRDTRSDVGKVQDWPTLLRSTELPNAFFATVCTPHSSLTELSALRGPIRVV